MINHKPTLLEDPTEEPWFLFSHEVERYRKECLSQEQKDTLEKLVNGVHLNNPQKTIMDIWLALVEHCGVSNYHSIKKDDYDEVLSFLQGMIPNTQ